MPPQTDRLIAERYALTSLLGRGAMGAVWLAEDSLLKRHVAIKEIEVPPGFGGEERAALEARLLREARAAARLAHPGIVSVYDVVEDEGRPWIVMEYVDAPTLDDKVKQEGPLDESEAARVAIELLDILEVAHSEGIVHRDVKPANVMCPADGHVKLADFGIASLQDDPKITQTGLVLGSPAFMAPEQATKGTSGPPGDLWSLGATLYQAVEGEPPFDKGSPLPTLTAVMTEEPRAFARARALAPAISALLRKDPALRPTIAEARAMLEEVVAPGTQAVFAETIATTSPEAVLAPTEVAEAEPSRRTENVSAAARVAPRSGPRERTNPWPWVALVAVVATLIAVPLLMQRDDDPREGAARQERRAGGESSTDADSDADSGEKAAGGAAEAPAEWATYTDPDSGYSIRYPEEWDTVTRSAGALDFDDPASGTYLRVAWTDEPGDDVMGRLREIADSFASERSDYEEIQMTPTEFQGHEAGLWEYSYEEGGAALHAYNLQFVIDDTYGFALNFQTREEDWTSSQELWDSLQATFQPPA